MNDLRRTGTPRPNSDPIFEMLGTTREEALNIGEEDRATTDGTFEFLLRHTVELEQRVRQLESLAPNDDPYFIGLGTGDDIPPYMRCEKGKRIRNRRMVKRDVEQFVDKLFKRKGVDDKFRGEKKLEPQTFQDFFHAELTRIQIHQNRVAEVAYNLLDACKRYSYDADIELFSKVMRGDCSETVLKQQMKMLKDIRRAIGDLTVQEGKVPGTTEKVPGAPTKNQIIQVCRAYPAMKHYRDSSFEQLLEKLEIDSPKDGQLAWQKLFDEDSNGNQYAFVECLRDLNLSDRDEYFDQLEEAICEQDLESDGLVNSEELRAAVLKVDSDKLPEDVDALIRLGLMIEKWREEVIEQVDEEGAVISTRTERVLVSKTPIHHMQELPHEAVEFHTNEFMSHVHKHPIQRDSPAIERKAAALGDEDKMVSWQSPDEDATDITGSPRAPA